MPAYEVINTLFKEPGAAFKEFAAATGQTLAVRTTPEGSQAYLENIWGDAKEGGVVRVRSPRMHDNVQGIRVRVPKENRELLLPYGIKEPLYNQDTITVEGTGEGAFTYGAYLLVRYSVLPGSEGMFRTWAEIQPRIRQVMGVEVSAKTSAVAGQWGGAKALNSSLDQFKRPSEYAILGYLVDVAGGAIAFRGTDIGELRTGGPLEDKPDLTQEWFVRLSEETGQAAIPCFQAANAPTILVEVAQASAAEVTKNVTVLCAQLR